MDAGHWAAVETGVAAATARMLGMPPVGRAAALAEQATVDLDTTDVEVYGRTKRGVADNCQGPAGRPPARGELGADRCGAGGPAGR